MAKRNETENQNLTWGTWEELLLACAVHRYGTKSWDSVAMEMQKRSYNHNLLSAQTCKQKFHDLKRRFMDQNDVVSDHGDGDDDKTIHTIPWLDELRKLRVAELKREVEHYDLSIVSLQSKVKRLKEERERSLGENEKEREKSDQEKTVEKDKEEDNIVGDGEPAKSSPEYAAGKSDAGEESDRDNQSVNESNSTDRKGENLRTEQEEAEGKPAQVKLDAAVEQNPAGECTKPAGEDSFNGSSDTIAKESAASPVENSDKAEPVRESGDSPELWESVAESKGGGEEGTKENSDVQSSVKSQPENEDQSPAIKHTSVKSQPLVDFLEIVRSHRLGSIFERRLESQETENYRSLIRQHIDLETVRTRLEEGWYSDCNRKFFRDLLLLFNNAMVFFRPKSSESMAAAELRQLVSKEITSSASPKPSDPSPQERNIPAPLALSIKPDTESSDSLLVKQKISGPIIACRKRSSLAAKSSVPPPSSTAAERKKEQTATLMDEKPVLNWKQQDKVPKSSINDAEEKEEEEEEEEEEKEHRVNKKKRTRERFTPTTRNSTKNSKTRTNNKNSNANLNENSEPKLEKKNNNNNNTAAGGTNAKKRGVANFLSRIKRSTTANNGSLLETLKIPGISSENSRGGGGGGGGGEQRRNGSRSESARKDSQASSRKGGSSGKQQAKERVGSPAKRSVGRPPKRAAAPPPPLLRPVSGKRSREAAETEAGGSRQAKKRSRK